MIALEAEGRNHPQRDDRRGLRRTARRRHRAGALFRALPRARLLAERPRLVPEKGLRVSGVLIFTPQPAPAGVRLPCESRFHRRRTFDNEAVYAEARKLLKDKLTDFATGLLTGGEVERTPSGVIYGSGCVPHACAAPMLHGCRCERPQALPRPDRRQSGAADLAADEDLADRDRRGDEGRPAAAAVMRQTPTCAIDFHRVTFREDRGLLARRGRRRHVLCGRHDRL